MDQLLVALDVDTVADARALADRLRGAVGGFKIGSRLFTSEGPALVGRARGARRPRLSRSEVSRHPVRPWPARFGPLRALGVWMVNVHASGGGDMMRAARAAADDEAARLSRPAPLVIAVTMLTSLSEAALPEIGFSGAIAAQVERLARLAQASGLDGVVASPHEIDDHPPALRQFVRDRDAGDP